MEPKHYHFIDALRGVAIASVILAHVIQVCPLSGRFNLIGSVAPYGVQLFFVLSAVTLLLSMYSRTRAEQHPLQNFFVRRFFRIAPAFYLSIVLSLVVFGLGPRFMAPNGLRPAAILSTFLFVNGWRPDTINSVVAGQWSIAVEMTFYLVLPLLFRLVRSMRAAVIAWLVAIFAAGVLKPLGYLLCSSAGFANTHPLSDAFLHYWFPNEFPVFLAGFCAFFAIKQGLSLQRFYGFCLIGLLFVLAARRIVHLKAAPSTFGILFAAVVVTASRYPLKVLVNRTLEHLGKVSFSAYLVHPFIIHFLAPVVAQFVRLPQLLRMALDYIVFVGITTAVATVTWRFIEVPFQHLGRSLTKWNEGRSAQLDARVTGDV